MARFTILLMVLIACGQSVSQATTVAQDTLLYNNTTGGNAGLWALSYNTQNHAAPVFDGNSVSGGFDFWGNDASLTPNPQPGLVGDINGDGITDLIHGIADNSPSTGGAPTFIGLQGRNTAVAGGVGHITIGSSPNQGFSGVPANVTFLAAANQGNPVFIGDTGKGIQEDVIATQVVNPTLYRWDGYYSAAGVNGGLRNDQATPLAGFNVGFFGNPANGETPIMADVNGDGLVDKGTIADGTGSAPIGWMIFQTSDAGSGLGSSAGGGAIIQGNVGFNAPVIDTLFGDLDGDGDDDVVRVDDRNGTGSYIWEIGLTTGTGINTGGTSFSTPFGASPAGTTVQEVMLADMNGDGLDDFVQYWEFPDPASSNTFGQFLVAFTGAGGIAGGFSDATTYTLTPGQEGNTPFAGNFTVVPEPTSVVLLGLSGLLLGLSRRRGVVKY